MASSLPSPSSADHERAGCTPSSHEAISFKTAVAAAAKLKAVAEPNRLRLLSLIAAHDGAQACVCDLVEPLGLTQPTVSHHLKVLVAAGLLTRSSRGSWSIYALVPGAVDHLADVLRTSIEGHQSPSAMPTSA